MAIDDVYLQYKKAAVHGLIMKGGLVVLPDDRRSYYNGIIDYYGGNITTDRDKTEEALIKIQEYGIDYENCTDPFNGTGSAFNGTENDSLTIYYMQADIALNNGEKFTFAALNEGHNNMTFVETIKWIHELTTQSLEEALAIAQERLDKYSDKEGGYGKYSYGYSCKM